MFDVLKGEVPRAFAVLKATAVRDAEERATPIIPMGRRPRCPPPSRTPPYWNHCAARCARRTDVRRLRPRRIPSVRSSGSSAPRSPAQ
ncbi:MULTISPECIES: hypothetical protein [unclassified Streptomyces]|uniref:hypothetical protein n=1 Tax=unclassified Streptomyces TaxID=2593676 RepID=UPI0033200DF5